MCQQCLTKNLSRRGLITGSTAAVAAATILLNSVAHAQAAEPAPVSPEEAFHRLVDGNARYVANTSINRDMNVGRAERAAGQRPFAAIVACADSRVAPEIIFDQGPGDLFIVRVAGNFINEDGLASLEYGVAVLGIQMIAVIGHTACGAVEATIDVVKGGEQPPGHIPSLIKAIRPSVETSMKSDPEDLLAAATAQNARDQADKVKSAGPLLSKFHADGKLLSGAGVYDISTGKVGLA